MCAVYYPALYAVDDEGRFDFLIGYLLHHLCGNCVVSVQADGHGTALCKLCY